MIDAAELKATLDDLPDLEERRQERMRACNLARLRLGREALGPMVSQSQFARASQHVLEVVEAAADRLPEDLPGVLSSNLEDEAFAKDFIIALNGQLNGKAGVEMRFNGLCAVLDRVDLRTWPMVSLWPHLLYPEHYLAWVPEQLPARMTDALSALTQKPDWDAYRASQQLAHQLVKALAAEDMITLDIVLDQISRKQA